MNNFIKLNSSLSIPWDGKFSRFPIYGKLKMSYNMKEEDRDNLEFQDFTIWDFQDFRFSGFQIFRISDFQDFQKWGFPLMKSSLSFR